MRKSLLILAGLIGFSGVGCTRAVKDDAKVSLTIPAAQSKVGAQSIPAGYSLGHIVVNVHVPGSYTRIFSWDKDCGHNCTQAAPAAVYMDVPSGPGRIIQYLGVYQTSAGSTMLLYYGDKTADLTSGENTVSIDIAQYGNSANGEGNIAGQYVKTFDGVNNVGKGPTGKVEVVFKPAAGAPDMVIEKAEMFNGWLNVFGVAGVPMQYRFAGTSQYLVDENGAPISFDNLANAANATVDRLVRFKAPFQFWVDDGNGNPRRDQTGGDYISGFFGPAAPSFSAAKACYYNSDGPVSNLYNAPTSGSNLQYCTSSCSAQEIQRSSPGGVADSSCNASNYGASEMLFKPSQLGNGKNSAAQFNGPFLKANITGTSPCSGVFYQTSLGCYDTFSTPTVKLKWNYLPNVFAAGAGDDRINGVTLFYKNYVPYCEDDMVCAEQFRRRNSDGYKCAELQAAGFTKYADYTAATTNVDIATAIPLGGNMVAILCPYKDTANGRIYFETGEHIRGNLRAGLPPISNLNVTTSADSVQDNYLVDANIGSHSMSAVWAAVPGAASYEAVVRIGPTPLSCTATPLTVGATTTMVLSGCNAEMSGGSSYNLEVIAKNLSGQAIAQASKSFMFINDPPMVTAVNVASCSPNASAEDVLGTVQGSGSIGTYDWYLSYGGTNSGSFSYSGTSTNFTLLSGMLNANTYSNVLLTITPVHSSGYQGTPYPITFNSTAGVCP